MTENDSEISRVGHADRTNIVLDAQRIEKDRLKSISDQLKSLLEQANIPSEQLDPDETSWFMVSHGTFGSPRRWQHNREGIFMVATNSAILKPQKGGLSQETHVIVEDSSGSFRVIPGMVEQTYQHDKYTTKLKNRKKGKNMEGLKFTIPNSGENEMFSGQESESLDLKVRLHGPRPNHDIEENVVTLEPEETNSYVELTKFDTHSPEDPTLLTDFLKD